MKKIFGVSVFEFILLVLDILSVIFAFIFFEKNWLSFSCSIIGCFAIFFLAKGYFFAPIVNIIYDILYIILSYTQNYFGETIIYLAVVLPTELYACFSWKKSKSKNSNEIIINKLKKKEWIIFFISSIVLATSIFFILRAIGTQDLYISTLSFTAVAMSAYLVLRKNNYYSLAYACSTAICCILWIMPLIRGETEYLPTTLTLIFNFLIEFYGFFNLRKLVKQQEKVLQQQNIEKNEIIENNQLQTEIEKLEMKEDK